MNFYNVFILILNKLYKLNLKSKECVSLFLFWLYNTINCLYTYLYIYMLSIIVSSDDHSLFFGEKPIL